MTTAAIASVAYLIAAHGATRLEAEQVLERIAAKSIPNTLTATLDILDTEILEFRS